MPSGDFVPRRTTRLLPGRFHGEIDVIGIAKAFGGCTEEIRGIQPRFGGKCFDITWNTEAAAAASAATGLDLLGNHFDLRLVGKKTLDVSVEFPDSYLVEALRPYREFSPTIRHLKLKEPGLTHIENGIRVVRFTDMTRPLPSVLVCRKTPLSFRYMGHPILCFKCASADHVVRDCPQNNENKPSAMETAEHSPAESDVSSSDESNLTAREETPETSDAAESSSDRSEKRHKRKRRRKDRRKATGDNPAEQPPATQEPFSPSTPTLPEAAASPPILQEHSFQPVLGPRWKEFAKALQAKGQSRQSLMKAIPGAEYYEARALWLQHSFGDFKEVRARGEHCQEKEATGWKALTGSIPQDAYAKLITLFHTLNTTYDLFPQIP